ncbi:UDP-N-acetylmuramoyl-tripeptide--D-alanyl-D-alanine ligase [Candidatus Blochmannia ocreatus (nom. nud.)]|uniref:UDP-N-acetylmuramoyl-tripeptide--D-alanyl-D-alanine ligase n=1 Tax=Candidatus Blochmannia ocreatus (nom. nud.) TaxID=251538 RepID=A0ABY4SZN3_9ENTR|nr:UDP-N-acetylmuramoyl-tripeptide--D-alanyl-D-alanine ligase [Candidatus Blochmannia ocreatus]URJ25407.1 UDP-N-acetylmuramoyl-tripeptide--D-alanyl-D-alanine ligase [Candidatus Blochmannia ocreatus]
MIPFNLHEIAPILNARHIGKDLFIHAITIDSNIIYKRCMFIALIGKRFNGHDFVAQAVAFGAQALLVNYPIILLENVPQLIVADTNIALITLASWVRKQTSTKIIAITGSSGKTSVKEMTHCILTQCGHTIATQGNLNNSIGVPITLLRLTKQHNFAIIELGSSQIGELSPLSKILFAKAALINNIYPSHLLGFGSLIALGREKGKIFLALKPSGRGIINADSHMLSLWTKILDKKSTWNFSINDKIGADFFASNIVFEQRGIRFVLHTPDGVATLCLPMLGKHSVANALAASALAFSVGASLAEVVLGLESSKTLPGRLFPIVLGDNKLLLDDTYNANVGSVISAINVLTTMPGYRILVMSDMLELGKYQEIKYHCYIGKILAKSNIDVIFTFGNISHLISKISGRGKHFDNKKHLIIEIKRILSKHQKMNILIKGSRKFKMEKIVDAIQDK